MKNLIILFLLFTKLLLSQDYTETRFQKKIVDGGEYFGARVLFFNEYLLFSANKEDDMGPNSGSVYAFKYINDEWKSSKIRLPYFHSDAFFGLSLASMDNLVFIGALRHKNINNVTTGGVLIYEYSDNTFNYKDRILQGDDAVLSSFGAKIKILNNELIISAYTFKGNQSGAGRVFIYSKENETWQISDTLKADVEIKSSFFGNDIDINNSKIIVGRPQSTEFGRSSGSAFIFSKNNNKWEIEKKLLPKNGYELMLFGAAVALSDSFAFVGAPGSIYDNESGKVYVYKLTKDDWVEFQILNGDSTLYSDNFGSSLHYNNDRLYIGAPGDNPGPKGAIYIYKYENGLWIKTNKITQSFASSGEWFGWSIDSDSSRILTGAPHRQIQGKYSAGIGYLFEPVTTNIDEGTFTSKDYSISQNYPNPFNPVTTIKYQIPAEGFVTLKVYDVLGKEVALLEKLHRTAGSYTVKFDASNLTSGLYIYEIRVNDFVQQRKMMVLK